ncbi:MAG: dual specificity protein phosphatase family protein [Candidatus Binatia bacterium]
MTDFYDPFAPHQGDGRSQPPEVSQILPTLFVGEYPRVEDIVWLKQTVGISAVLSLQDSEDLAAKNLFLPTLENEYQRQQVAFHQVPVTDFDCQSLALTLPMALEVLRTLIEQGHTTFVHCNAGCNRAPTLAIAYLHTHHSMTLAEARDFVKARRACGPYMEVLYRHFGRPEQ